MKKLMFFELLVLTMMIAVSCYGKGNKQGKYEKETVKRKKLTHEDITGKFFIGNELDLHRFDGFFDDDNIRQLKLYENDTFYYIKNRSFYNGTWKYNKNNKSEPYVFEWLEEGNVQRCDMEFFEDSNGYVIWKGKCAQKDKNVPVKEIFSDEYKQLYVKFISIN